MSFKKYIETSFDELVFKALEEGRKNKDVEEDKSTFVYAAAQAKKDGKKEFIFAGKKYPVTIKTGIDEAEKVECPQCEGEGCDHCDGKGYHLTEAKYQVDIKGAGRETVMAKNEREAITKAAKKMKVHSYKTPDVTVKLMEEVELEEAKLDPVNPKAVKKDFDDRKDKDLDNDGDVDDSDEYLHKRRKAVSKAIKKDDEVKEQRKYRTPTQAEIDADRKKDQRGQKKKSISYKDVKNRVYKNYMGGLRDDTNVKKTEEAVDNTTDDRLIESKFADKDVKMAIGIASDKRYKGGNMTGAVRAIEKIQKGLSNHPQVAAVLKRQNESVELDEMKANAAYTKAAKDIKAYAAKDGGIDKKDMMNFAADLELMGRAPNILQAGRILDRINKRFKGYDTDVRDRLSMYLKKHGLMESSLAEKYTYDVFDFMADLDPPEEKKMKQDMKKAGIKMVKPKNQSQAEFGGDHVQFIGRDEKSVKAFIDNWVGLDENKHKEEMESVQENVSDIEYTARNHLSSDRVKVKKAGKDIQIHVSSYHDPDDLVKHINQLHKKKYKIKAVDNTFRGKRITIGESLNEAMTSAIMIDDFFSMDDDEREKLVRLAKKHNLKTPIEKRGRKNVAVVDGDKKTMQKFEKELKSMGVKFTATESVELEEMYASTTEPHKSGHRPKVVKTQPNGKTTMSYLGQHVYKSKEHARNAADHIAKGMRKGKASDSYIDDFARRHHKEHGMKEEVDLGESKDFDAKFQQHLKFAISGSPKVKAYLKKKAAERDAMNKKNDPNAAKKGYALSAVPPERKFVKLQKARQAGKVSESLEAIKSIVAKKQAKKIDGMLVDMFTASAIMQVYNAVNDQNKEKMEKVLMSRGGIKKIADFAFKQVESINENVNEENGDVAKRHGELKQMAPVELMKLYQKYYNDTDVDGVKEMEKSELISKILEKEFENQGEE